MGWREEIVTALGEWISIGGGAGKQPRWKRVGRAARTGEAGQYAVDLRGSDIGPDQLDSLRLAGPESDSIEAGGFTVSDSMQNGSLLTLRVAEFADIPDPHLWILKQPPTFLIEALRDGISGLGQHPLAAALAAGTIGGPPARAVDPPGFHPAQGDAYRACLGEGVHLVWGPPGTGKTTVLKRAIGDLIAQGDRVLRRVPHLGRELLLRQPRFVPQGLQDRPEGLEAVREFRFTVGTATPKASSQASSSPPRKT